jgi:hypothetical protein
VAYEAPTLDTSNRAKLAQTIQSLADAGLSDSDILNYFNQAQGLGRQSLQDYFNVAGTNIAHQFSPQFEQARNTLGSNPLLADSGYANRLNRQLLGDLYSRMAGDYGQRASDQSGANLGFYRDLVGQRAGLRSNLAQQAYGAIQKTGIGALVGGPAGAAAGGSIGGSLGGPMPTTGYGQMDQYQAPQYQYGPTMQRSRVLDRGY